jgi:hypothetical protein
VHVRPAEVPSPHEPYAQLAPSLVHATPRFGIVPGHPAPVGGESHVHFGVEPQGPGPHMLQPHVTSPYVQNAPVGVQGKPLASDSEIGQIAVGGVEHSTMSTLHELPSHVACDRHVGRGSSP